MSNGVIADANPLNAGSNPNSVESAAAGFDRLFGSDLEPDYRDDNGNPVNQDGTPREPAPRRSERKRDNNRPTERIADGGDDPRDPPDPARSDDGHAQDDGEDDSLFDDPILGDEPPAPEGDEDADTEDEGDEETDDEETGDLDLDREVEVVVNGETQKVKLSEALAGYSRDADYRQKTAALATERQEVEEYAGQVVELAQHYEAQLTQFVDMAKAFEPSQAEWDALKAQNPQLYIQTREQWEAINKKVTEAQAERDKIANHRTVEETRKYREYVRKENEALIKAVPALANPKKAKEFRERIFAYGKAAGYSQEEIMQGAVNHRDVLTLYKAARYDEIQRSRKSGQRPNAKKEPKPSPSSKPRNVSSRAAAPAVDSARKVREAENRLARTGSVKDAADAFTAMLSRR